MGLYSSLKGYQVHIIISVIFIIYTLGSFGFYYERTLQGDLDNHILAGEMFGTPAALKAKGIEPLYHGEGLTGWDGQFYYYIANDLLALKDTPEHIDAPPYRYQRVGLPLFTGGVAAILGQGWVSPSLFISSYFLLLVLSVWLGAKLMSEFEVSPFYILIWACGVGTQITLFNALPDAAADAFLIIAILLIYYRKYWQAIIPFSLAALSREVYVLIPSIFFLVYFIDHIRSNSGGGPLVHKILRSLSVKKHLYFLLPGFIVLSWHFYIFFHLGSLPMSNSAGILGAPFASWAKYLTSGLMGHHLFVVNEAMKYETILLFLFMCILLSTLWFSMKFLVHENNERSIFLKSLAVSLVTLIILYICFGPVVIMHYTGYTKAIGFILILSPVFLKFSRVGKRGVIFTVIILVSYLIVSTIYNYKERILATSTDTELTRMGLITETADLECIIDPHVKIDVKSIIKNNKSVLGLVFGIQKAKIEIVLTNLSKSVFTSTKGLGSIHMSYQWLNKEGEVVHDGIRTAILEPIFPGESQEITLVVYSPSRHFDGNGLKLSPVQEGCNWFYQIKAPIISPEGFDAPAKQG